MSTLRSIRIGTRASPLAIAQTSEVVRRLSLHHNLHPDCFEIIPLSTKGDRLADTPLPEVGVKGLFTFELEERLLAGELELAVHSSKDVATSLPKGLHISAFLPRDDVRDALISRTGCGFWQLPQKAVVGTSSIRRQALVSMHRPDLIVVPLRGFVGTRLQKLESGAVDATLLAMAGLNRLDVQDKATEIFDLNEFPPSPAQGAICIESAVANHRITEFVSVLEDLATADAVKCERAFLRALNGSCRTPIGAHAVCLGSEIVLRGMTINPDGTGQKSVVVKGKRSDVERIGEEAALFLLK